MSNKFKLFLWSCALFTLGGAVLSTWVGPKFLEWFYEPPVELGVSCGRAVAWAMQKLVQTQIAGALLGLALGIIISFMFLKRQSKSAQNN